MAARRSADKRAAPCLGPADSVVQIRLPGQKADHPVQPAEQDLSAAQVADSLDPQAQVSDSVEQRTLREVHDMEREVEGEPPLAEQAGLPASPVRRGHNQ